VAHLDDGRAFEQHRQGREALIVQMKVEVHVLVDRRQFIRHGFVQQLDALFDFHDNGLR
jgi:hypothetical protein